MACDGNCGACKSPCSAANFMAKISKNQSIPENDNNKMECNKKMSENIVKVAGCGAPSEPDHIRANAAIVALQKENEELRKQLEKAGAPTPLCFGIKNTTCLAALVAAVALGFAIYALSAVGKYSALIESANKASGEALANANQANQTASKALTHAENAENRAEKNYIYLRGLKQDLRGK